MVTTRNNRLLHFVVLFGVLLGFSLLSLGVLSQNGFVKAVEAAKSSEVIAVQHPAYESKVLQFLQYHEVCSLTSEQAQHLATIYPIENKEFIVNNQTVKVLYVGGVPLNKHIIEEELGTDFGECHVVHGSKVVALVTPVFVS